LHDLKSVVAHSFSVLLPFEINLHLTLFADASNFFIKAWELELVIRRKKKEESCLICDLGRGQNLA